MAESSPPSPNDSSDALTLIEKLVDVRLLVLVLAFLFYLDIWALREQVNPTALTIDQLRTHLHDVPLLKLVLFFAWFTILMGVFFPAVRYISGAMRLALCSTGRFSRSNRDTRARRLSDWALGLVAFSVYDSVLGWCAEGGYRGLVWYLGYLFENNSFELVVLRVTCVSFWFACLAMALEIDD